MKELTDSYLKTLVPLCEKGDRSAQKQVFNALYSKMLSVCMRYYKDHDKAQDILQEGFIKVFSNLHKYDSNGSFEGWARRVIVNTAIDELRKKQHNLVSVDASSYDWLEDEGDGEIEWNEFLFDNRNTVLEAVQNLSPAYKAVFNLYVIEGYSHQEVADMLGVTVGTSKSNLAKAKMALRKELKTLIE
tara:strand:- start:198 stop:761 length:564 start_codon:yes stop_codon:yes gene_type:complete